MLERFIKEYADASTSFEFVHTAMVRHNGVVIAFAMDSLRRIHYAVLNLSGESRRDSTEKSNSRDPLDVAAWPSAPSLLAFPPEIARVGYGVADQRLMPVFKQRSERPEPAGARLPASAEERESYDLFRSTTAQLSALAPFQVLSDGQYIYLFRQAIAGQGAAPIVDASLLLDRFMLVEAQLQPKLEVRFQRSRSKTRPQSRKDSLGPQDLDGAPFYEPTQELGFVGKLSEGRFSVLLLPTAVSDIERWQIFAYNARTKMIDSYDVERGRDGLFNTRGSQAYTCEDHPDVYAVAAGECGEPVSKANPSATCDKPLVPRVSSSGHAEWALALNLDLKGDTPAYIALSNPVDLGPQLTVEAWIKPAGATKPGLRALLGPGTPIAECRAQHSPGLGVWLDNQGKLRIGFGDGARWYEHSTSRSVLTLDSWSHLAVTLDARSITIYVDGMQKDQARLDWAPTSAPVRAFGASGKLPSDVISEPFSGVIDEIRLWRRARRQPELQADKSRRLLGSEVGLAGYWRFDEGRGGWGGARGARGCAI